MATVTVLFGLMAQGQCQLDENRKWVDWPSKRLFLTRDEAMADEADFRRRVCEPTDDNLECLSRVGLTIHVVEYELTSPQPPVMAE